MTRRLSIAVGPSPSELKPIPPNDGNWVPVTSPSFEGYIAVHIKGLVDEDGNAPESPYFDFEEDEGRKDVTWSFQIYGRLLRSIPVDDIVISLMFEKPLHLPWGCNPLVSFLKFLSPKLEDGTSEARPWTTAPVFSTMTYAMHTRHPASLPLPPPPPAHKPIREGMHTLVLPYLSPGSAAAELKQLNQPRKRRAFFANLDKHLNLNLNSHSNSSSKESTGERKRQEKEKGEKGEKESAPKSTAKLMVTPDDVVGTELCYGRISFPDVRLRLPLGLSFDLLRFTGIQPLRIVACTRNPNGGRPRDEDVLFCGELRFTECED
ncbi:hypothetical protein BOTBODRAFT_373484 [Botryobasidium botryosum FD-172 SS1]|uniref:Domain of unknown function at the cortex 1 domain-containing protein n=1 Tax=Botryobasidium botryosum (strain FD-172 SS1) TaxID=930990 RepID=A0A067MCA1_BOTB1|nr:hypothetical protein BOTBODRAFT_373484 [Botryobasidium botryosum FD-172 SS1]